MMMLLGIFKFAFTPPRRTGISESGTLSGRDSLLCTGHVSYYTGFKDMQTSFLRNGVLFGGSVWR